MSSVCCTLFFHVNDAAFEEMIAQYDAVAVPSNGYLTRLRDVCVLVDATATETADWARQTELAAALTNDYTVALSIFAVGSLWAIALARNGQLGPVATFTPDNPKTLEQIPHKLLALERQLADIFPDDIDADEVDALFGSLLEGAVSAEEGMCELVEMLGVSPEWFRWSWYETIPEQIFLDPDLADRVIPLGEARALWEE